MRSLILLCLFIAPVTQAAIPLPLANEALLHSARMWEARERGDLALLALKKLIAARPDSPQALQELGELALRMGDIDTARSALDALNQRFINTMHARTFDTEFRIATRDRLQLASLQRQLEISQYSTVAQDLARLFPEGAPQGFLAIEYYRILAKLPGKRGAAIAGLRTLGEQHPDEPRYALALANLLNQEPASRRAGMALLTTLGQRDDIRQNDVDDALIASLLDDDSLVEHQLQLEAYVRRHPDNTTARQLLGNLHRKLAREAAWNKDVLTALGINTSNLSQQSLAATLQSRRNQNAAVNASVTAWHEFHFATVDKQADPGAHTWHDRALTAFRAQRYGDAQLDWQIATALRTADLNAGMQAVTHLANNNPAQLEAGELLATLTRQHPHSSWPFTAYLRWLIEHSKAKQAWTMLNTRPVDVSFTANDRTALQASALRAMADTETSPAEKAALLEQALALAPQDIWLRYRLANVYADQQQIARGTQLMLAAPDNQHADVRYAQALYLDHVQASDEALAVLDAVPTSAWNDDIRNLHTRLSRAKQAREIEHLISSHREIDAAQRLDILIQQHPDDVDLQRWRAELDLQLDQPQYARDRLALLVAQHPDDARLRLSLVRALIATHEHDAATVQLAAATRLSDPNDTSTQLLIAWRAYSLSEWSLADQAINHVLAQQPAHTEALILAGRIATATRHYAAAQDFYTRAEKQADTRNQDAHTLRLALMEARSQVLSAGLIMRHKPGDAGVSRFDSLTLPTAWRMPWPTDPFMQSLTLRADVVQLDAGTLAVGSSNANELGKIYVAGSNTLAFTNAAQHGVALGAIFSSSQWRADIGTTPVGFLIPNLVGNAAWTPNWHNTEISLGMERRAITSSVLSYAGLRDPATGEKFGGVISTGITVQAGHYLEDHSRAVSLKLANLTGTQVQTSQAMTLRLASDWRIWQQPTREIWSGITLNVWRYQHNVQHTTWGQGGYYSPQSYVSLALPVTMQGSNSQWSYQLRVSVAYSHSHSDDSPYYPTDMALQTQAEQRALIKNDTAPVYTGGSSSGLSFSAAARTERKLTDSLVVGGELSMDRADYYHPVELSLYLRHPFGVPARIVTPPRPLLPYND